MSKLVLAFAFTVLLGLGAGLFYNQTWTFDSPKIREVQAAFDWRADWALKSGFTIEIDSQGFQLPTSIAFVPKPGDKPDDPLYFVTELFGTVRVVTNDRTVHTFAEGFFDARDSSETGLGAICLDPSNGYVFVTFASPDDSGVLRNDIIRFQSRPGVFSLSPKSQIAYTDIFASFRSGGEHQIGHCSVEGDLLYVSVGDGSQTTQSQQVDSVLGKVLRMTLDGEPVAGNPFFLEIDGRDPMNYVWAMGLRNPFGLEMVDGRLFVADNGVAVDRFLEIRKGVNYLWDGSDASIGTNADYLLSPGHGVAQLAYYSGATAVFPDEFAGSFFMTITGTPSNPVPGVPALQMVLYDLSNSKVARVPSQFLGYRGSGLQVITGVDFGPDGLYFSAMFPNEDGTTAILKVRYTPGVKHPYLLSDELNPIVLMNNKGCFACHTLNNNGGGTVGPVLDKDLLVPRILGRLNSETYLQRLEELKLSDEEPFVSFRENREAIDKAEGLEKVDLWLSNRIQEPRFDDPNALMPNLGITVEQAERIASYLSGSARLIDERTAEELRIAPSDQGFIRGIGSDIKGWFPTPTRENAKKYVAAAFVVGLAMGVAAFGMTLLLLPNWRRWRARRAL